MEGHYEEADRYFTSAIANFAGATGAESPSTLRSRIHQALSVAMVARSGVDAFARLETARSALVRALGSEDRLPIWQLDLIVAELAGRAGMLIDAPRVARARVGLPAHTGQVAGSAAMGINSFN